MTTAAYRLAREIRLLAESGGWLPQDIPMRAEAGLRWVDFIQDLDYGVEPDSPDGERVLFRHALAALHCDGCGVACGYAPWRRHNSTVLGLGMIWSSGPRGPLHFCEPCTEGWYDSIDERHARGGNLGATELLSLIAIQRGASCDRRGIRQYRGDQTPPGKP